MNNSLGTETTDSLHFDLKESKPPNLITLINGLFSFFSCVLIKKETECSLRHVAKYLICFWNITLSEQKQKQKRVAWFKIFCSNLLSLHQMKILGANSSCAARSLSFLTIHPPPKRGRGSILLFSQPMKSRRSLATKGNTSDEHSSPLAPTLQPAEKCCCASLKSEAKQSRLIDDQHRVALMRPRCPRPGLVQDPQDFLLTGSASFDLVRFLRCGDHHCCF